MARLQILELPSGINDERPPFMLVIDEYQPQRYIASVGEEPQPVDEFAATAELIGARAVLAFQETVTIPANEPPLTVLSTEGDDVEHAGTTEIVYAHERTRLDLCSALLLDSGTTWRKLIGHISERQRELAVLYRSQDDHKAALLDALGMDRTRDWDDIRNAAAGIRKERDAQAEAIERVRRESTKPEIMSSEQQHPAVWMHGYECGVLAAKAALRPRAEKAGES